MFHNAFSYLDCHPLGHHTYGDKDAPLINARMHDTFMHCRTGYVPKAESLQLIGIWYQIYGLRIMSLHNFDQTQFHSNSDPTMQTSIQVHSVSEELWTSQPHDILKGIARDQLGRGL